MSNYICEDCGNRFSQMEQTVSEHMGGQDSASENIKEEGEM